MSKLIRTAFAIPADTMPRLRAIALVLEVPQATVIERAILAFQATLKPDAQAAVEAVVKATAGN